MTSPDHPAELAVVGYLRRNHDYLNGTWWSLLVPCPGCDRWHNHGAGAGPQPIYEPGSVTNRVAHGDHGGAYPYGRIVVVAEPFDRGWQSSRGRKTKAWHSKLGRQGVTGGD